MKKDSHNALAAALKINYYTANDFQMFSNHMCFLSEYLACRNRLEQF